MIELAADFFDRVWFGLILTLVAWVVAKGIERLLRHSPVANPILLSVLLIGAVLFVFSLPFESYRPGGELLTVLLGPAVVALALPIQRNFPVIRAQAFPLLTAILLGTVAGIAVTWMIALLFEVPAEILTALATKHATTPIAVQVAEGIGGSTALAAATTIVTGIIGAVSYLMVARLLRIKDRRLQGLALGTSAHVIGTAQGIADSPVTGAFSAAALPIAGVFTALLVPVFVPFLLP